MSKMGFDQVETGGSLDDVKKFIRRHDHGWLITSLFSSDQNSYLTLLNEIMEDPKFQEYRSTLLLDSTEKVHLAEAYSLGVVSWVDLPANKEAFSRSLDSFLRLGDVCKGDGLLMASHLLRGYFEDTKDWDNAVNLEQAIYDLDPEDAKNSLNLGKVLLLNNRVMEAKMYLRRAIDTDKSLQAELDKFLDNHAPEKVALLKAGMGISSAVIVDSDPDVIAFLTEVLKDEFGVDPVDCFGDGEEAWQFIKRNPSVGLIIQEWKLRTLGGPELLQRIRGMDDFSGSVVVASSLIKEQDAPLIGEMYVADVIEKPLRKDDTRDLLKKLVWQDKNPTELKTLEYKIINCLKNNDLKGASQFRERLRDTKDVPLGVVKYLDAEFAFTLKRFKDARTLVVESIKLLGKESTKSLNLLGKCLLNLNDLDGAARCFEKAQSFSPNNISRLCELASVNADRGDLDAANEQLAQAKSLDEGSEVVQNAEVKVAMVGADKKDAKELMRGFSDLTGIVGQMNNRAVTYIRSKNFDLGRKIYQETLDVIPDEEVALRARVTYNMGLAAVKENKLTEAEELLIAAGKLDDSMGRKVKSLRKKVKESKESGIPVKLSVTESEEMGSQDDLYQLVGESGEKARKKPENVGVCLYKVFYAA